MERGTTVGASVSPSLDVVCALIVDDTARGYAAGRGLVQLCVLLSCVRVHKAARQTATPVDAGIVSPDCSSKCGDPSRAIVGVGQLQALGMTRMLWALLRRPGTDTNRWCAGSGLGMAWMLCALVRRAGIDTNRWN